MLVDLTYSEMKELNGQIRQLTIKVSEEFRGSEILRVIAGLECYLDETIGHETTESFWRFMTELIGKFEKYRNELYKQVLQKKVDNLK